MGLSSRNLAFVRETRYDIFHNKPTTSCLQKPHCVMRNLTGSKSLVRIPSSIGCRGMVLRLLRVGSHQRPPNSSCLKKKRCPKYPQIARRDVLCHDLAQDRPLTHGHLAVLQGGESCCQSSDTMDEMARGSQHYHAAHFVSSRCATGEISWLLANERLGRLDLDL